MEKLADIFEAPISGEWGTELDDSCTGIPVLRTTNFTNDGIISFDNIVYRNINLERKQNKILRRGDIVIEKSGGSPSQPVGRVVYFDLDSEEPFVCNNFTAILRLKKNYNPSYIFYLMHFLYATQRTLNFQNKTTGIANLKLKDYLEQTSVNIPSIEKQNRCVAVLEYCQQTIARYINLQEKLDTLVKSRFIEMFGDPVTNPMGWEVEGLGKVCDVRDGTHDSPAYCDEGFPLVTSKNVSSGKIDLSDCSYIAKDDYEKINQRSKVDKGDIIMPMIGTVGIPVIVNFEPNFAIKNVALIKFNSSSVVHNVYIKVLLESNYFDNAIMKKVRGGTQKFISLGDIRKLQVLVPPIALQNRFADFVQQVDKSKSVLQKLLEKQELLQAALMQEYFG